MSVEAVTEREVTAAALAAVVAEHDLAPGFSQSTGRAFVEHDGVRLWADLRGVVLAPWVPGMNQLCEVRGRAFFTELEAERAAEWEAASPEQRVAMEAERRRIRELPDPPDWQMEHVLERQGRL